MYSSSSDTESEEDSRVRDSDEDPGDASGPDSLIRKAKLESMKAERKAKRRAEREEADMLAKQRLNKIVKLNKLTSISSGGGAAKSEDKECYRCGEKGHMQDECRNKKSKRPRP